MTPVRSSNVDAVGYDEDTRELYVRFTSGDTYVYSGVTSTFYKGLLAATSAGRFLNDWIKPRHQYRRL